MDSIVHFENERFIGRTNFRSGLLNSLVVLSVQDIDGVAHMSNHAWKFRRIFNRSLRNGVDVRFDYDGVVIEVCIWTKFGFSAADVCYRVQESVINVVSGLIEDKIKNVNVRILGVESNDGVQQKEIS
jgi:uncharacterized alkaline shock family protein YloU